MFLSLAFVTGLFALARGQTTLTGQYTCLTQGNYELCNNQWGISDTSGNDISWSTTWTWADNENESRLEYLAESSGIRADVSYDIWFGTTSDGAQASSSSTYEIMIRLSGLGGQDGNINDFNVDLNEFFSVSSSLYLQGIKSGTEPFTGPVEPLTNSYSVAVTTA
ncbi:concanavalin A-like lectin/glucanase [Imleria badia]|nr:concanavalin A-like lectin/glucanase [Imleria badia]